VQAKRQTATRIVRDAPIAAPGRNNMLLSNIKNLPALLPVSSRACTLEDLNLFFAVQKPPAGVRRSLAPLIQQ